MKQVLNAIKDDRRGETLMESIVSLLIFSFIIIVVVSFATTGLAIVRYSNTENRAFNEQAATVDSGTATGLTTQPTVSVSFNLQDQAGITRRSVANSPLDSTPVTITDRGLVFFENEP